MTTAHRPTFDPARGKEAQRGVAYHQRLQPAHTKLKVRKPGQGGDADAVKRDMRAQLLAAEEAHYAKMNGGAAIKGEPAATPAKHALESKGDVEDDADADAKRRRILEETRHIDAESSEDSDEDDDDDEDDDEDESDDEGAAALARELAKIKAERSEQQQKEEQEKLAHEQEEREKDIALGNPLLNPTKDFNVKRRWDDDVVFKNQARGTEDKRPKEFVNDLLRSDFHKRFMSKYVR